MSKFLAQDNIVPRPNRQDPGIKQISIWLDEQIWGHRIYDSQSPWLIFLEFLNVAEACLRKNSLFIENDQFYPLKYTPYRRMYLRNILFNSEQIARIDDQFSDSTRAWDEWTSIMDGSAQLGSSTRDFSYLINRFASFHDFARIVQTLRSTAVESHTNRRWSSRFIFPFGPNSLYEDLNVKSGTLSREYINFGRTGELLYQMLCRCSSVNELRDFLSSSLNSKNSLDNLVRLLQPKADTDLLVRGYSYLPYISHPAYDSLGEDWLNIFKLQLPGFDAYQYLVILSAFHVILYQLQTSCWFSSGNNKVNIICEIIAPKKTLIRELSIVNYQENNVLTSQAVDAYISDISKSEKWQKAIRESANESDAFIKCKEFLNEIVWWDDYDGPHTPSELIKELRERALKGHGQHVGNAHRVYGRTIGLVSKRGTNRLRYSPNDAFLKALLIANVPKRMELNEFLNRLYQKYGLVFGEHEAEQALSPESYDQKAFQANTARLERRLRSMGMLRRLSDACAYVINPFSMEG